MAISERDVLQKIADALKDANIRRPRRNDGSVRDQVYLSDEDSMFLAGEALRAIRDAGCAVVEDDHTSYPKRP